MHIKDNIHFDETKPLEQQSEAFMAYAYEVFAKNDYTDMSLLRSDKTCAWIKEQDGLRFIAKRVYLNVKQYTVKEFLFTVEKI